MRNIVEPHSQLQMFFVAISLQWRTEGAEGAIRPGRHSEGGGKKGKREKRKEEKKEKRRKERKKKREKENIWEKHVISQKL